MRWHEVSLISYVSHLNSLGLCYINKMRKSMISLVLHDTQFSLARGVFETHEHGQNWRELPVMKTYFKIIEDQ